MSERTGCFRLGAAAASTGCSGDRRRLGGRSTIGFATGVAGTLKRFASSSAFAENGVAKFCSRFLLHLVVAHAQRSRGQILQHVLQRKRNIRQRFVAALKRPRYSAGKRRLQKPSAVTTDSAGRELRFDQRKWQLDPRFRWNAAGVAASTGTAAELRRIGLSGRAIFTSAGLARSRRDGAAVRRGASARRGQTFLRQPRFSFRPQVVRGRRHLERNPHRAPAAAGKEFGTDGPLEAGTLSGAGASVPFGESLKGMRVGDWGDVCCRDGAREGAGDIWKPDPVAASGSAAANASAVGGSTRTGGRSPVSIDAARSSCRIPSNCLRASPAGTESRPAARSGAAPDRRALAGCVNCSSTFANGKLHLRAYPKARSCAGKFPAPAR